MGTPDFAVESLKALIENKYNIVGIVTNPDKPAGRGKKIQYSAVKEYALDKNIPIFQPDKMKNHHFVKQLRKLEVDLQVVVAFRILPEIVWNIPRYGTFNLHASYLPDYRGAAPINWAIINGEKETGLTTFFIDHKIDTGKIIYREKVKIKNNETAGELHDKLKKEGAKLVLKTVYAIADDKFPQINQSIFLDKDTKLNPAPKIYKEDCKIPWVNNIDNIHNLIRGLCPSPAAWTEIISPEGKTSILKIFNTEKIKEKHKLEHGALVTDNKTYLKVAADKGFINIKSLQLEGKKRLQAEEFLRGMKDLDKYCLVNKIIGV